MSARTAAAEIAGPEDFARAFNVSRETIDKLSTYEALLRQWQKTINLVAPSTLDAVWSRHFAANGSMSLARPKSTMCGRPRSSTRMLEGFRSR